MKLDRKRQIPCDLTYMQNLNNKVYKQTKQKQTHIYTKHIDGCQWVGRLEGWVKKVKKLQIGSYKIVMGM